MRISHYIARVEDKIIANAPVVKAQAKDTATKTRTWLSTALAAAAVKVAPKQG